MKSTRLRGMTILTLMQLMSGCAGQIFFDAFYARFGSGTGGIVAMGIPLIGAFCCGAMSVASNSRRDQN